MGERTLSDYRAQGATTLDRLGGMAGNVKEIKVYITGFAEAHKAYEARQVKVDQAHAGRDEALSVVGKADGVLDASLDVLADKMVGAGLGKRQNPFAGHSRFSPSELKVQAMATEATEVRAMVAKILKAHPPADVVRAATTCDKNAQAVEAALGKLSAPQAAYAKAIGDRDALLPQWVRAYNRLKKHAAALWDEDLATFNAVFAPPEAVQRPVKSTKARKKTKTPVPAPAPQ